VTDEPSSEESRASEENTRDAELFRSGDRAFFDRIVQEYRPLLRELIRRYVPTDEDAEDVAQLTFARAFEHRELFRGDAPLRSWLCRIAVNLALNHRKRARPLSALGKDEVELEDIASFTNALETAKLVAAELWRKAEKHLARLPPKQRLVVELRLFHEMSFREIGALADCSEVSARVNCANGMQELRTILNIE